MGILRGPAEWIKTLDLPRGFSVCELGDQYVTYESPHRLAREFYEDLGCTRYDSIDANGRATIAFDLNRKWKARVEPYDLVTDFGTGEHIFNQAEVWRTLHVLTKKNGFIVFDRPAQGYEAHGFYGVHETLYRDLAAANRYLLTHFARATTPRGELLRGVFKKLSDTKFANPQQGRYQTSIDHRALGEAGYA